MSNITCPAPLNSTKIFKIPMYAVVLAAGLPLNCLALWALVYQMKRSVILSVYITNLMLANLLQILMLPFGMYSSYQNHCWGLGKGACMAVGIAFRTNFYAKNSFLCLIAMERYIGLVHPLRFHRLQTMQGATKVSIVVWLLVMTLCVVGIVLEMETQHKCCLDFSQLNYNYALYRVNIVILSFFIPCILMGFCYFRVLAELRKVVSLERRVKRQIYGFISFTIAAFFLLFTPFQVMLYYRYYWEVKLSGKENEICDLLADIYVYIHATQCLTILGNILDPLLYILLLKDVRKEFKVAFSCRARQAGIPYKPEQQDGFPTSVTERMQNQLGTQDVTH